MRKDFQISVNTWIFGAAPIAEVILRAKSIGFDGIELVGEPKIFRASEIKQMIDDAGLKVFSICGMHPVRTRMICDYCRILTLLSGKWQLTM